MSFEDQFAAFAKFGDTSSDGKHITLTQSDKWMKQANVIDGKRITTTDTSIHYKKQKSPKLSLVEYKKFIEDMATTKKVDAQEIYDKMTNCGAPGQSNTTKSAAMGVTDRLTDTSKYTGSHKERFDASGKGKGIEGRADVTDNDGYVSAYKNKDTYDKTHPQ